MTDIEATDSWQKIKCKLKRKFAVLTKSDNLFLERKEEELIDRLQIRLGKTKEELSKIIAELY
ncbi:MAG: hypothetical protein K0M40_06100 [Prolixibacteraceae bacterium]|nr:hypothetical protein [Prolixibacteraceae bacterium]